ncbi:UDP-glucose 4-epimerase GalE [Microlunatus parietis]|uniref:UDP-glucose 4-epimerase n=1 Tax=Microlunatus parietis TaxID=682979 RepID=A0A7Y9ICE7_9ACTN|nr:UDP-glucose 4-epimerase GalE [Microlunatus parietis]NYE74155.1 UDP-glucose 4-epimerase [Microlunatus parietis]
MRVLVTGGAGYLGSMIATALERAGHQPVILDNLVRGRREFVANRVFYEGDIADRVLLEKIVADQEIDCTIHCAALIVVPESVREPYRYYVNNVAKSLELCQNLVDLGRPRLVFSSSAAIYAFSDRFEVDEAAPLAPTSPYARTKMIMELALRDLTEATDLRAIMLRYFNPIGSDPEFRTGIYDPVPSHVIGRLVAAAEGRIDAFEITGTDLPTRDGTGLRDYIGAWDLARAHVAAVERFDEVLAAEDAPSSVINLGTGSGVTVRELLATFEEVYGRPVPTREKPPRSGDAVGAYAGVDKAHRLLGWRAEQSLADGIASALEWGRRRASVLPDLAVD